MQFNVYRSTNRQYFFTVDASNGRTLATSETYHNKADAVSAAQSIKTNASTARIVDNT